MLAFAFFSHPISNISHNISNVSFSSSLNRLNAFSHYQKICTHQQCAEPEFRLHLEIEINTAPHKDKHCTTASLVKVPPLKLGVYLIIRVHYTLFTDPTYNPGQSIWYEVEKSSKVEQDFKSLFSNFACFLTAIVKV